MARHQAHGGKAGPVDDDDLADAFRTGSAEGFRAVYERYSGAVFTIALRILCDRELAADAVQVTSPYIPNGHGSARSFTLPPA
jgi:hypothetical protein